MRVRRIDIEGTPEELAEVDLPALMMDDAGTDDAGDGDEEDTRPAPVGGAVPPSGEDPARDARISRLVERYGP
ncbi:MAG: hypothetical protein ABR511_09890 [Acidimicrobiales bacterium]